MIAGQHSRCQMKICVRTLMDAWAGLRDERQALLGKEVALAARLEARLANIRSIA
jgi:hypothetical protein